MDALHERCRIGRMRALDFCEPAGIAGEKIAGTGKTCVIDGFHVLIEHQEMQASISIMQKAQPSKLDAILIIYRARYKVIHSR